MKAHPEFSQLTNDMLYGHHWGLFEDELGQALRRILVARVSDGTIASMIHQPVERHKLHQAFDGNPFRQPRLDRGELILGLDLSGRPLRIPLQYLNAHSLTVAGTGSGKTTKSRFLVLQIAPRVRGMWLMDLRKTEFRLLRPYLARLGVELIPLPGRRMRINPLQIPDGTSPQDWAVRVSDMLVDVLGLPPRASKLIQTALHRLYQRFGVFNG